MRKECDAAIVSIMNGIGDAFLALGAIRNLRIKLGLTVVFILTTHDIEETVYRELGESVFALNLTEPNKKRTNIAQIQKLADVVSRFKRVAWYSLNSYFPPPP